MTRLTDRRLAEALEQVKRLEAELRATFDDTNLAERDQAVLAGRLATPLRRQLETWVSVRALRAQLAGSKVQ